MIIICRISRYLQVRSKAKRLRVTVSHKMRTNDKQASKTKQNKLLFIKDNICGWRSMMRRLTLQTLLRRAGNTVRRN